MRFLWVLLLAGCAVVPDEVHHTSDEVVVRHIIQVELPEAFTNYCVDNSGSEEEYAECINQYVADITNLIQSLTPEDEQ